MEVIFSQFQPQIAFHPGETLMEKMNELGLDSKEIAAQTNLSEETIIGIISGKSAISLNVAQQLDYFLIIPTHFWLNMQRNYDNYIALEKL